MSDTADSRGAARRPAPAPMRFAVPATLLVGAALGALLLVVAEFTTLFTVHAASTHAALRSQSTGSHDHYALLPLAVLAFFLAAVALRTGSRTALAAITALGIAALLFGLVGDLSDAQRHGVLRIAGHLQVAGASPSAGLYMETLGAVLLIITGVIGLLLTRPTDVPARPAPVPRRPRPRPEAQ
jgi:hypothetical protein